MFRDILGRILLRWKIRHVDMAFGMGELVQRLGDS
jgi:hypothetical protein